VISVDMFADISLRNSAVSVVVVVLITGRGNQSLWTLNIGTVTPKTIQKKIWNSCVPIVTVRRPRISQKIVVTADIVDEKDTQREKVSNSNL
jgi:hypothetical protein